MIENNAQNAPKLTPEQAKKLKGMLNLSKYTRWVFFASILIGVVCSIVASIFRESFGGILLLVSAGIFAVTVICAIVMFWNVHRIKGYLKNLGIRVE